MMTDGEHPLTCLEMALQAAEGYDSNLPLPYLCLPAAGRKNNHQKAKIWAKEAAGVHGGCPELTHNPRRLLECSVSHSIDECYFPPSLAWRHMMGPAISECYLPHDYLCCRHFLAVPSLCWDAFCLLPSVCPAVRQPRIAIGSRAAPRGIAQSDA